MARWANRNCFFFIHVSNTGKTDLLNRTTGVDEGQYVIFSDFSIICICNNYIFE